MTQLLPMMMYCFVMSITPGPNNLMLTASGANFGYRLTLPQVLGCVMGNVALTLVACNGLGQLFVAFPIAQAALRTVGALYLVWLAWKLAQSRIGDAQALRPLTFVEGVMFQAFNPKSWIRAITLASVFMPAGANPLVAGLAISLIGARHRLPVHLDVGAVRRGDARRAVRSAQAARVQPRDGRGAAGAGRRRPALMFTLDRNSPVALADQIEARLRELVARGQLPRGRAADVDPPARRRAGGQSQHGDHRVRPARRRRA